MDIKDEVAKALAQEEIQKEIAKIKSPPKGILGKIGDFLNSNFAGWLLGTFLLTVFTVGWTYYQETYGTIKAQKDIAKSREDSEFLVKILPLMANDKNLSLSCQSIQALLFRHPEFKEDLVTCESDSNDKKLSDYDQKLCKKLRRFILNHVAPTFSQTDISSADFTEAVRSCGGLLEAALKPVDERKVENPSGNSNSNQPPVVKYDPKTTDDQPNNTVTLPARVYIQIYSDGDRPNAEVLQSNLRKDGILALGIENVGDDKGNKASPLSKNVIRYYHTDDDKHIEKIKKILPGFEVQRLTSSNAKIGTIEVWFKTPGL